MAREPVTPEARKAMGIARKRRIHERENGKCWLCTKLVDLTGPKVVYDHRLPLELGGSDQDRNIFPLHAEPCNRLKTAADIHRIAKMRRQSKMDEPREPTRIPGKPLEGRPFDKSRRRKMNGQVEVVR